MKLYLVRHTTAADIAPSDAQRPLTLQGEKEARHVGAVLAGVKVRPSHIFSSPLLRAQQTAGIIGQQLGYAGMIGTLNELTNGAPTAALLKALPAGENEIILVGHMPSLAEHVATVTGLANPSGIIFGKGSIGLVDLESPAKLVWIRHFHEFRS